MADESAVLDARNHLVLLKQAMLQLDDSLNRLQDELYRPEHARSDPYIELQCQLSGDSLRCACKAFYWTWLAISPLDNQLRIHTSRLTANAVFNNEHVQGSGGPGYGT